MERDKDNLLSYGLCSFPIIRERTSALLMLVHPIHQIIVICATMGCIYGSYLTLKHHKGIVATSE